MRLPMPVFGNAPDTVRSVKDPTSFGGLCDRLGIPHPAIRLDHAPGRGWLSKRSGGAGGSHVRPATPGRRVARGRYAQQRVPGGSVSALFLANGTTCRILGFSEQWPAPQPRHPFRYGGAAAPACSRPAWKKHCPVPCTRSRKPRGCAASAARIFWSERTAFTCWRSIPGPAQRSTCLLSPACSLRTYPAAEAKRFPRSPCCPASEPAPSPMPAARSRCRRASTGRAGQRIASRPACRFQPTPLCTVHADAPGPMRPVRWPGNASNSFFVWRRRRNDQRKPRRLAAIRGHVARCRCVAPRCVRWSER